MENNFREISKEHVDTERVGFIKETGIRRMKSMRAGETVEVEDAYEDDCREAGGESRG